MKRTIARTLLAAPLFFVACGREAPAPPVRSTAAPAPTEAPAPPRGARVGAVLAPPLDEPKLAAFLFTGGDAAAVPRWRPRTLWQTNDAPPYDAKSDFICHASDPMPFIEAGKKRAFVLTSANLPDHDCVACAPLLGAAALTEVPGGWRLDAVNLEIEELGVDGRVPDGEPVALGADRHGILLRSYFFDRGETNTALVILAPRGASFADVLTIPSVTADNSGACEEGEASGRCWGYDSTWEFVPSPGKEYFDLRVKTEGTRREDDGRVGPYEGTRLFVWDGTKYVKR